MVYHVIRRVHLFTSLVLAVFVLMYFVTGWIMIHETRFPRGESRRTILTKQIQVGAAPGTAAFRRELDRRFGVRGKSHEPKRNNDGSWMVQYFRPGTSHEVLVTRDGEVTVTRIETGTVGIAHGLHRLHGYGGGWLYSLWAAVYDLASVSLIVFAGTGVYLWYRSTSNRVVGWLLLGLSTSFTVSTIIYFLVSR